MSSRSLKALALTVLLAVMNVLPVFGAVQDNIAGKNAGYMAVLYDSTSGLPTSEANAIAQTRDGFIWIGGYSGLIRYDGTTFDRFDASTGISSVVSLFVDSSDRLWVGTNDSGAAVYQNGEFKFFTRKDGLRSSSIRSIEEDVEGNIIIATTQGIAAIDKDMKLHAINDAQLNEEYVCELRSDHNGVIYGETLSGAIFSIEDKRITAFYSPNTLGLGVIASISPDFERPGWVYLGTEERKIIHADMAGGMSSYTEYSVAPEENINCIMPNNGLVWICADNGIGYLDGDHKYYSLDSIPLNNSIDNMIVDYEGNMWFASSRQGVMKIVENDFADINAMAGLPPMVVNSTCIYEGFLYIGTDSGLYILDRNFSTQNNVLTDLLDGIRIRAIKTDSKGNLWLATYSDNGLVRMDASGTCTFFNEDKGLNSNRVRTMEELSDGTLAVATSGGVNLINGNEITASYDSDNGINNTEILSLAEGDEGELYMGSDGDGIYVLKGKSLTRIGVDDGLTSEVILRIKKDPVRGGFWLITSNSIVYMKDGKIDTIGNFPYSNNFDIYFADNGEMWILSSDGIYVVDGDEMVANGEIEYTHYDTSGGLPCIATANSRSCLTGDGILYISGGTGVCSVNINESSRTQKDILLAIPSVEADGTGYPVSGGEVTIPANVGRVIIGCHVLTYELKNPKVSYFLSGSDREPIETDKQSMREVVYTNLKGGKHTFTLNAEDPLTGEILNSTVITINKTRAYYESPAFMVLIVLLSLLLVGAIVWFYFKARLKRLERKREEDRRLIAQLSRTFAKCIDIKDTYTNGHSFRVAAYTKMIAGKIGCSDEEIEQYYNIALLHDLGKIGIPDKILNKPEALDDEEYKIMKTHAQKGLEILSDFEKIEPELAYGAGYHHERYDGKGYPKGLKGDEIPKVAQIIAVADTFDAMYSTRPYRKQLPLETVMEEIQRIAGAQLNPELVEAFVQIYKEGKFDDIKA